MQLPETPSQIPHFLDHVWAFDHVRITTEDTRRTELYRHNIQREQMRRSAVSFDDFLKNLRLETTIQPILPEHVPRVAQLTHRTNQFNLTTIRRSEDDVRAMCAQTATICLEVHVRDRFGDYGLVGVLFAEIRRELVRVDTFLLSCRALGRRVEHHMLTELARIAAAHGCSRIDIPYIGTARNQPAQEFLRSLEAQTIKTDGDSEIYSLPIDAALMVESQTSLAG